MKHKSVVRWLWSVGLALAIISGCNKPAQQPTAAKPKPDVLVADMDPSVNPGDDFFASMTKAGNTTPLVTWLSGGPKKTLPNFKSAPRSW